MLNHNVAHTTPSTQNTEQPDINWAVAYNLALQKLEDEAVFDQYLDICLKTMHQEMQTTLSLVSQTVEQLTETKLGPITTQQYQALSELKCCTKKLQTMLDGLNYISRK